MRTWLAASGARRALIAVFTMPASAAGEVLKVCLDEDLPPLSAHHRGAPDSGFDVALAQAVASKLGRPLSIQWFGSKLDEDSAPALKINRLFWAGPCPPLGVLAPSRPYTYSPLTIVLGPKAHDRRIGGVGDLAGLRIGIESGTVADAILMTFGNGRLIDDTPHLVPGRAHFFGA